MIPCPGDARKCCPQGVWLEAMKGPLRREEEWERAATSRVVIRAGRGGGGFPRPRDISSFSAKTEAAGVMMPALRMDFLHLGETEVLPPGASLIASHAVTLGKPS